jgi:hypothetical protein
MVREPARAARLAFERDAGQRRQPGRRAVRRRPRQPGRALPLLQYCLDELYRQRGDDGTLRFEVFRQLGGIEGALGVRAEQVVAALPAAQQAALPQVLSLLVAVGDEQHAVTARRPAWAALGTEAARDLVRALVEARLFVSELSGGVRRASAWLTRPCCGAGRAWRTGSTRHRQDLQVRTRVTAQAERWAAGGRPADLLLPRGSQVERRPAPAGGRRGDADAGWRANSCSAPCTA